LLVGLSVQDDNLKRLVLSTQIGRRDPHDSDPPKIAFCAERPTASHERILRLVHEDYDDRRDELAGPACLPPCSKPLLGGLFVEAVLAKARLLVSRAKEDPGFPQFVADGLDDLLSDLECRLVSFWEQESNLPERWRRLATVLPFMLSRAMSLYRWQSPLDRSTDYHAILPGTLRSLAADAGAGDAGLHRSLVVIVALIHGERAGYWELAFGSGDVPAQDLAQFVLQAGERRVRLFICRSWDVAKSKLALIGAVEQDAMSDAVLIHPVGAEPRTPRSRLLTGRLPTADDVSGELWAAELAIGCETAQELATALRNELLACGAL
jgi:hypothetical protein